MSFFEGGQFVFKDGLGQTLNAKRLRLRVWGSGIRTRRASGSWVAGLGLLVVSV